MKKTWKLILLGMLFAVLTGCHAKPVEENVDSDERQEVEEVLSDLEVNKDMSFEEAVAKAGGDKQTFLIKNDVVVDRAIAFTGKDIVVDGGDERARIEVRSSGAGFMFKDINYPKPLDTSATITFKNIDFCNKKSSGADRLGSYVYSYTENVTYENCSFEGGVSVWGNAVFRNCTFRETTDSRYCIFVDNEHGWRSSMLVVLEGCSFDGNYTAYGLVKVADDSAKGANLKVTDCSFSNIVNKSAVYVNGSTNVITDGTNTYTDCVAGHILAKGSNCNLNGVPMQAGVSYD